MLVNEERSQIQLTTTELELRQHVMLWCVIEFSVSVQASATFEKAS